MQTLLGNVVNNFNNLYICTGKRKPIEIVEELAALVIVHTLLLDMVHILWLNYLAKEAMFS